MHRGGLRVERLQLLARELQVEDVGVSQDLHRYFFVSTFRPRKESQSSSLVRKFPIRDWNLGSSKRSGVTLVR